MPSAEDRINELEFRLQKLHELIVDPKRSHFNHVILDYNLTRSEVNKIFGLMDELSTRTDPVTINDLKESISEMVPRLEEEDHFVIAAIRSLYEDGKYPEIYKQLPI
jgi:Protein of unknown function (DUF1878)